MLLLFWLTVVSLCLLFVIILLLIHLKTGLFQPEENIESVVLRGKTVKKFVRIGQDSKPEKTGSVWSVKPINMPEWENLLLYRPFGLRFLGIPFVDKIGEVIVNYPPQIKSVITGTHSQGNVVNGFDIHHTYKISLEGVDFQGGIALDLSFTVDIVLKRPDVAWGRNGAFLDPLGQAIEGAVKSLALTINATDFVGTTEQNSADETSKARARIAKELRDSMCRDCMALNNNANQGSNQEIKLADLCGYEIRSIQYNNLDPSDDNSRKRFNLLEEQNEAFLNLEISRTKKEQATVDAEAKAASIKGPGLATVEVDKAAGLADAEVLKAKVEAVGSAELIIAEMNATAIRETGLGTLVMGGGVQPMLQIPTAPVKTEPKMPPKPEEKPTA